MKTSEIISNAHTLCAPYRITDGKRFRLADFNPGDTGGFPGGDKESAKEVLKKGIKAIAKLQDRLWAQDRWSVLMLFQAMDAAGKDGAIKHVMSGINPQGCEVTSFKGPTAIELDHDYLWRCNMKLPERGRIGIFNRSYYEEVLVVKVHPGILQGQKLPPELAGKEVWKQRYQDIASYEQYLARNGTVMAKFFLHLSREEQKKRFLERIEDPDKNWKFSAGDAKERAFWDDYMNAYEEMIRETATKHAPWYVVPADNKWYTRLVVAAALIDTLSSLDLQYPKLDEAKRTELESVKKALEEE